MEKRPAAGARKWAFRAISGAGILALVLSHRDTLREVGAALGSVSPLVLIGSVLFYWLGQALSAYKWQVLLRARGVDVSLWACCQLYLAGMFGNLWLPTNIGGDALRAARLHKAAPVSLADATASIAVERLTGFAALLFLAALGLLFRGARGNGVGLLISAAFVIIAIVVFWKLLGYLAGRSESKPAQRLRSLRQSLDFYAQPQQRGVLVLSLFLSLVFQSSQVLLNIGLARAVALALPAATFWWLAPLLSLSGLIPAGIGGFGVREAAAIALLKSDFPLVASGQIVAWSLLWQATVWLSSLPGVLFLKTRNT